MIFRTTLIRPEIYGYTSKSVIARYPDCSIDGHDDTKSVEAALAVVMCLIETMRL